MVVFVAVVVGVVGKYGEKEGGAIETAVGRCFCSVFVIVIVVVLEVTNRGSQSDDSVSSKQSRSIISKSSSMSNIIVRTR